MRRTFVAVTLAIGAAAALYGALIVLDLLARSEARSVRPLPVTERVVLETGSGDLAVVAGPGPARVELRTTSGLWGEPRVTIDRGPEGLVTVDADCPGISFSCSAEARLVVPAGTAIVARTGSGSVIVRGTRSGVEAETGSGDIELEGVGGTRVAADTGSGEVDVSGDPGSVRADTGSGDVALALTRPPDDVDVDTGSGEVTLRLPDVGYAIATDTGSGDERVDVRRDDASGRRIRIDTGSGDVSVRPPR